MGRQLQGPVRSLGGQRVGYGSREVQAVRGYYLAEVLATDQLPEAVAFGDRVID